MEKAWNKEEKYFGQSYEDKDILDSAVLIMPLVFFLHAVSPHFGYKVEHNLLTHKPLVRPQVHEHAQANHENA